MKTKKSKKANVDQRRGKFTIIGFILTFSLMIAAFQWNVLEDNSAQFASNLTLEGNEDMIRINIIDEQKEKEKHAELNVIKDDKEPENSNTDVFKVEATSSDSMELPDIIEFDTAKKDVVDYNKVFIVVEKMPEFPGGYESMMKFLSENINYPEAERDNGIEGLVVAYFVIEKDGSHSGFKILHGVTPNINNEALRVLRSMPKWKPGKQRGKAVRVSVNMPIRFTLSQ